MGRFPPLTRENERAAGISRRAPLTFPYANSKVTARHETRECESKAAHAPLHKKGGDCLEVSRLGRLGGPSGNTHIE